MGWEITDTNDLRWFDVASSVDIILNQSDYPVGPPQFDGYGNFTGYASNESQSPNDVNVIQLFLVIWQLYGRLMFGKS